MIANGGRVVVYLQVRLQKLVLGQEAVRRFPLKSPEITVLFEV